MEQWIVQFVAVLILGFVIWLGTRAEIAWRRYRAKKTSAEVAVAPFRFALSKRWRIALLILIIVLCVVMFFYGLYL